jgi:hypothetical protein
MVSRHQWTHGLGNQRASAFTATDDYFMIGRMINQATAVTNRINSKPTDTRMPWRAAGVQVSTDPAYGAAYAECWYETCGQPWDSTPVRAVAVRNQTRPARFAIRFAIGHGTI